MMFNFSKAEVITSSKNGRFKDLLALKKGRSRREAGHFVIEGAREIARAIKSGFKVTEIYVCNELMSEKTRLELTDVQETVSRIRAFNLSDSLFARVAMREDQDGILALAEFKESSWQDLTNKTSNFILIAEGVEKPGNLGALLRSADGAGIDALFLIDSPIDLFAPQTIRASLGAAFHIPVFHVTYAEAREYLLKKSFKVIAADPAGELLYTQMDLSEKNLAIVVGGEAFGLQNDWRGWADLVRIPMLGICDSLNVSVSGAVLLYEALRQRTLHKS